MKILCEKAITFCDYSMHIWLLDMTKAVDSIDREHLYNLLSDILDPDHLKVTNVLLKDMTLQVINNKTKGQSFTTTNGIPQGDCLSVTVIALYLSNALSPKIPTHLHDHKYYNAHDMFLTPIEHLHDHNYRTKQYKNNITCYIIDQQCADDNRFISSNKNIINKAMKNIALISKKN